MNSISRDTRNSSIELLRIICMLFVVAGHVVVFGIKPNWQAQGIGGGTDYVICHSLYGLFVTAVDVFVLISGWFSIKFNWRKIKNIWLMLITYSWFFFAYKAASGGVNCKNISYLLPVLSRQFWFVSVYFILCFLSPALNKLVDGLSKKELRNLLVVLVSVTYVWATISYCLNFPQIIPDFGGGIVNFVTLYLVSRYLRLYVVKLPSISKLVGCLLFIQVCALCVQLVCSRILGFPFTVLENDNSLSTFLSSICILLIFVKIRFHSRLVNACAGYVLAVYILHMNDVAWPWLARFFSMSSFHGLGIVILCIYAPIAVFAVGSLIEFIRINIFRLFSK